MSARDGIVCASHVFLCLLCFLCLSCAQVYIQGPNSSDLRLCVPSLSSPILDPQISPDGRSVAFVCDNELFVASTSPNGRQLPLNGEAALDPKEGGTCDLSAAGDRDTAGEQDNDMCSEPLAKRMAQMLPHAKQLTFGAKDSGKVRSPPAASLQLGNKAWTSRFRDR